MIEMQALSVADSQFLARELSEYAEAQGVASVVARLMREIACLEGEDHARALVFLAAVGKAYDNALERAGLPSDWD